MHVRPLETTFFQFNQDALWADKKVENVFEGLFDHLKNWFLVVAKDLYSPGQKAENNFPGPV
jgi:hypothetical protein